jgi:hypothetical protein
LRCHLSNAGVVFYLDLLPTKTMWESWAKAVTRCIVWRYACGNHFYSHVPYLINSFHTAILKRI